MKLEIQTARTRDTLILHSIKLAMDEKKLLTYNELFKESKLCRSTFSRHLEELSENGYISIYKIKNRDYYALRPLGELTVGLDNAPQGFFFENLALIELLHVIRVI